MCLYGCIQCIHSCTSVCTYIFMYVCTYVCVLNVYIIYKCLQVCIYTIYMYIKRMTFFQVDIFFLMRRQSPQKRLPSRDTTIHHSPSGCKQFSAKFPSVSSSGFSRWPDLTEKNTKQQQANTSISTDRDHRSIHCGFITLKLS